MPIEGPVRELAPSDLLQLLYLSRRTGSLYARDDAAGREVVLELENGALASATGSNIETRLGRLLVGSGRATDGQIERALAQQRAEPGRRIGEILVESRSVRPAEVERHLRLQIEEAVFDLMRWQDGHLRFEERPSRERRLIEVRLPTDAVLMDAARRLDEWALVTASAPDPDPVPRLAAPSAPGVGVPLSLRPEEWEVLAKVDGATSLRKIALGLGRSELDVARAIYALVSAGVVEVGARVTVAAAEPAALEDEIRAIEAALLANAVGEAERRVDALLRARGASPGLHVLRGRVLAVKEDWRGSIRAFEKAIELDPLLPVAYFHLARASVRIGDLRGARSALATYRRLPDASPSRLRAAERLTEGLMQLTGGLEEGE